MEEQDKISWSVDVYFEERPFGGYCVFTTDPKLVAEWASLAHPRARVSVQGLARTRLVYVNGQVVSEQPDINQFYDNISPQQQHLWQRII